jgi:hypothetical protein
VVYLGGGRLADDLGARAVELLMAERTVDDAPEVLRRIRALLGHYRTTEPALPRWSERFVTVGYAHYCTLLPTAFVDGDTGVRQVAAMLGFLFSMESLAISLGCERTQLELAVRQSRPEAPAKVALLWAAQSHLGMLSRAELRSRYDELLANPLAVPAIPLYLSGFVQGLEPAPGLAPVIVEVMSKAFARLPDAVLLPWLPKLIMTLRDQAPELMPRLVREAGRVFPGTLPAVDAWVPPWSAGHGGQAAASPGTGPPAMGTPATGSPAIGLSPAAADLVAGHAETCDAVAALLGYDVVWRSSPAGADPTRGEPAGADPAVADPTDADPTRCGPAAGGAGGRAAGGPTADPGHAAIAALVAGHPGAADAVAGMLTRPADAGRPG